MKVLIIDPDEARAALVAEGLGDVRPLEVHRVGSFEEVEADLARLAPDVIVIACESPDRDTLESLRDANEGNPRPVVMFVDRSTPGLAEAAVEAGVAAYVVDGLSAGRVRPVLEVAMSRFELMQKLRAVLKAGEIPCIFPETQHDPALIERMAEGTGVRIGGALDPVGSSLEPGPGAYAALLEGMAGTIADCLAE